MQNIYIDICTRQSEPQTTTRIEKKFGGRDTPNLM